MKLEEKRYYWKDLAHWMGYADSYFKFNNNRANKLLELGYYADFEEAYGGVLIKKVKHEEYNKKYSGWLTELTLACTEIELAKEGGQWIDKKKEVFAAMNLYNEIIQKKHMVQDVKEYFVNACQKYLGYIYYFRRAENPAVKINEEGKQLLQEHSLYNTEDLSWAYFNSANVRDWLIPSIYVNAGIKKEEADKMEILYRSFGLYDGADKAST